MTIPAKFLEAGVRWYAVPECAIALGRIIYGGLDRRAVLSVITDERLAFLWGEAWATMRQEYALDTPPDGPVALVKRGCEARVIIGGAGWKCIDGMIRQFLHDKPTGHTEPCDRCNATGHVHEIVRLEDRTDEINSFSIGLNRERAIVAYAQTVAMLDSTALLAIHPDGSEHVVARDREPR